MSKTSSRINQPGFLSFIFASLLTASVPMFLMWPHGRVQAQTIPAGDACQPLGDTSVILSVVTEQFYDRSFNGLNWPVEISNTVAATACDDSPATVVERINELLARLDASHTAVYSQQDLDYWGLNSLFYFDGLDGYTLPFPGIWAIRDDQSWFVSHVFNGSPAQQAGISAGDELISLNSQLFAPTAFIEGNNQLEISSDGNTARTVDVIAPVQSVMRALVDASAASAQTFSVASSDGEKAVGYYRIWAVRDQIQRDFQAAVEQFTADEVDALIVDLRGGFGGSSEDYLAPIRFMLVQRSIPLFFLIDDSVRSGKELLAAVIRRDQLGTLVGATTAGYFLAGRMNRLLNERYFLYVAVNTFPPPGTGDIEGVGVAPDVEVEPCKQHCNAQDPILQRALELIAQ
jgi:carboxyl-terminal processing protease